MTTESSSKNPLSTSKLIRILAILLVLAIVFCAGMALGYRKAEYSYRFSDKFFQAFGDRGHMRGGMMAPEGLVGGHGSVGKVISANLPNLIISDREGVEKTIRMNNETVIRAGRSNTASTTVKTDDFVVVVGIPNDDGSITAKLIRIMPQLMMGTSTAPGIDMMYIQK